MADELDRLMTVMRAQPGIDSPAGWVASRSPDQRLQWLASLTDHDVQHLTISAVLGPHRATAAGGQLALLAVSRRPRWRETARARKPSAPRLKKVAPPHRARRADDLPPGGRS
jgi:hypothetical protein